MIDIQEVDYCKILVKYESDGDTVRSKKTEVIDKFKGQKVPGFRPGHATTDAIKQHYRKEINEALKQELADDAVHNVIFEKNIKPFGRPTFSYVNLEESYLVSPNGESAIPKFRCEFSLHVQPEFELKAYKEFDIPKSAGIMSAEELTQKMLQELRTKQGDTVPYGADDFVQMGDTIILDFDTTLDGVPVASLTGAGEILNVGRINIPGFNESLLGMKPEESREFDLNMPDTYSREGDSLAGKTLHFKVKISTGSKTVPAPLNDDLAKKLGLENFESLLTNARATASNRVNELENNHYMDQISRRIIEAHDFRIPSWIASSEAQINARNAGQDWDSISDEQKEKFIDMAEKSVKLSLVLIKIRESEPDAQLSDEEVFELAKKNLAKYSPDPDKVLQEIYKNGHLPLFFNRIRDEHTLSFIQKTCNIIE